jgi:hypothetical protein
MAKPRGRNCPVGAAWAPRHVGRQLRQVRTGAEMADLEAVRSQAEELVARERGEENRASRHGVLSRSYTAMSRRGQGRRGSRRLISAV